MIGNSDFTSTGTATSLVGDSTNQGIHDANDAQDEDFCLPSKMQSSRKHMERRSVAARRQAR